MSKISTNISIDSDVKKQAQELFADLGLDLSTAINMFLRQAIRNNAIPFEITRERPNTTTLAAIEEISQGKAKYGPFDSVEQMMEALNA